MTCFPWTRLVATATVLSVGTGETLPATATVSTTSFVESPAGRSSCA